MRASQQFKDAMGRFTDWRSSRSFILVVITGREDGVGEWWKVFTTPSPRPVILSLAPSLPSATSTKWRPTLFTTSTETASYAGYEWQRC